MSSSINIGCTSCGQKLSIASPDSIHTEALRGWRLGYNAFDYIPMDVQCTNCKKSNWIYWFIKPLSYWYGSF
jgi:hypothetical protein